MSQVFLTVLHMSLAAAILALAVIVVRFLLQHFLPTAPKALYCVLWALVALRLVLPVSVESPFSLIPEDVAQGEVLSQWRDDYVGTTMMIFDQMEGYDAAVEAGREQYYAGEPGHYYVVTGEDGISAPPTVESERFPIYGWVWLVGCAAMVGYAAVSFLRVRRRVRVSLHLRDNIWRCEAVDSPFILGFVRPKIYLPYNMSEEQAQYVIAHEEAHLRRRDHWWKPLGFLLLAVHWFNPLLWVAYILLCRDIELACDEKVIREMDAPAKKAYSEALLACSMPRRMVAACPLAFGEVGVKQRIASVLDYKKPAFWVLLVAVLACLVVAVCFLTNPKQVIDGKVYTYEKAGVLGNFTITLYEDGTFHYTEGMASSYYATGHWYQNDNYFTLIDDGDSGYGLVNYFLKEGDDLIFLAEGSSNFTYVAVQDGERFTYTFDTELPIPKGDWDAVQTLPIPGYAIVKDTLTETEMASLNELLAPVVYDKQGGIIGASPWSCFFTSYYSDVRALDFEKFMRYFPGDGSKAGAAEFELLKGTEGWPFSQEDTLDTIPVPIHKYPARLVDSILSEYAGITTAEVDTSGVAYLEEYDAYYNYTSDFGAAAFHCTRGERLGDTLYLYEETEQRTTRLTLQEVGDSYHVVALQPVVNGEAVEGEFVTVAALFDTIVSSPADASKPADYLKAHSSEHIALLSDENTTLRYIFTEFLKGNQPEPKGQLMRIVLDELAPEAQLRLYAETGQEYFDEWIKGADQIASDHGLEWMQHNQPNMYLALQIRSEIYGHSSPVIPTDAPELPEPFDLDTVTYRAACDGILASLSTGWWTGQDLDPAKEAAAFTCFFRLDTDGIIKLYGFGGYFSQDAQGNAADEWSSFTIVTLNRDTLELVEVWWPGDGAYYEMSISENFPGDLGKAALAATPQELQKLHKQLKKQAAENMVDTGLSLPAAQTRIFKRDGLELEVSGVRSVRQMNMVAEGVDLHEYAVFVCDSDATITVLNADLSDPAYSEDGLPHPNWGLLYEDDTRVRITDEMGTVPITPDLQCVYNLEASLSVLDFEIVE